MDSAYEPRFARIAGLIADPARSRMLAYLLGGHAASAGELARAADVGASTASGHLARLLDAGLLLVEPRGRHRYYRLADEHVARALESLALVAERSVHERDWAAPARQALRQARRCYGHLAGRLGVALHDTLCQAHALQPAPDGYDLTDAGRDWLAALGLPALPPARGRFACACLDWSERRDHLAGRLGQALLTHCLDQDWLQPSSGAGAASRALRLTPRGRQLLLPRLTALSPEDARAF